MGARYRCSLHGAVRHQVKTAQTQPYVSDSVPTGGGDRCNKLSESSDGQKENTHLWEHPREGFLRARHAAHIARVLHH